MIRIAALAMFVTVIIDGDSHVVPRELQCMTVNADQTVILHLKGDAIFSDGFEHGLSTWRKPPSKSPCGD